MATAPDQSILEALRGYAVESSKQPSPRLVKIYISSSKHGKRIVLRGEKWKILLTFTIEMLLFTSYFFFNMLSYSLLFICGTIEFKEERKVLLEVIGPELQSIYDDRQIEVSAS
jgi:hypothetical protein